MEPLLKPAEVGELLGVSVETLKAWRYKGTGPNFIPYGKHVRYRPAEVDAWLRARTVIPGQSR